MAHPDSHDLTRWLTNLSAAADRQILGHLLECPTCREKALVRLRGMEDPPALADLLQYRSSGSSGNPEPGKAVPGDRLAASFQRLSTEVLARAQREQQQAKALFEELLALPPARQEMRVRNGSRYHSPVLAQRLLEHSRELGYDDPAEAERLARLGVLVIESADAGAYGARLLADLRARAWSHVGNALRQQEDLDGAEEAFRQGSNHLKGTADPLEEAGFLHLLAALRRVQRRFDESQRLLQRAAALCRQVGDREKLAQILTSLGVELLNACETERALAPLEEARALVDAERDPRTALYILHNLVVARLQTGRILEAQRSYLDARPLYQRFSDRFTEIRRRWTEGCLALHTGQPDEAERLLLAVRREFEATDQPDQVAAVSLDLATLYARERRTHDLQQIVAEVTLALRSTPVRRDARAAFALLSHMAQQEQTAREVMVAAVKRAATLLKRSRHELGG